MTDTERVQINSLVTLAAFGAAIVYVRRRRGADHPVEAVV
jgi:hypothetical protein